MTLARIGGKLINLRAITVAEEIDGRLFIQFQGVARTSIVMDMEAFERVLRAHGIHVTKAEHVEAAAAGRPTKEIDLRDVV